MILFVTAIFVRFGQAKASTKMSFTVTQLLMKFQ